MHLVAVSYTHLLGAGGGAFVEVVERSRTQEEQKLDEYYSKCYEIINQYYEMSIESALYEDVYKRQLQNRWIKDERYDYG